MSISTEIINVLDNLCQKFGIIVDWTNDNIFPYIEQICQKIVNYEFYSSIVWIIIACIAVTLFLIFSIKFLKKGINLSKELRWEIRRDAEDYYFWGGAFVIFAFAWSVVILFQVFDIVTCCTFPEKIVFDYIRNYIPR